MEIPTRETRYEEQVKAPTSSANKGPPTIALDYHLTCDRVRKGTIPPHRYYCAVLIFYALNVVERLQDLKAKGVKSGEGR